MSSPQFPTYGRGDEPDKPDEDRYARPAPYGAGGYRGGDQSGRDVARQDDAYSPVPGPPGHPYGGLGPHPQQQFPTYGRDDEAPVNRNPHAARVLLAATVISAVYGLLVLSVQRVSLREISQAPGSALNHPLRTDVIDTVGQVTVVLVGLTALVMWVRDLLERRKAGRTPDPFETGGLALVGVSLVPLLVWFVMVLSTGMGAIDDSLDRLPTAYGWGGTGLLILAAGFALGYRELKPEISNPVILRAPDRPPWE